MAQSCCPTPKEPSLRLFPVHLQASAFIFVLSLIFLRPGPILAHVSPWPEGTIGGLRVPPALLDVLDPGGHTVDPGMISCSDCLTAFVSDGYCHRSHIGYVDGRAYVSRLSYLLAKDAQRIDTTSVACAICRLHLTEPGWCDRCGRGLVGNLSITNRADFNEILMERERLIAAVRLASHCDLCAVAFFTHSRCSRCHIDYNDATVNTASVR